MLHSSHCKSAYANDTMNPVQRSLFLKWGLHPPAPVLSQKVTWEKLPPSAPPEQDPVSQQLLDRVAGSTAVLPAAGSASGLIPPIVPVCLKGGVQQGEKQDPSKFMPLCEREEKGCGVRGAGTGIIPCAFVKGPLLFCAGRGQFKRPCHNGSIGMICGSTMDVASPHQTT